VDGDTISFVETLSIQDNEIRITYTGELSANVTQGPGCHVTSQRPFTGWLSGPGIRKRISPNLEIR
jgi:hypothetical protein